MKRKARHERYTRPDKPRHFSPREKARPEPPRMTGRVPQTPGESRACELAYEEKLGEAIVRLYRAVLVNELPGDGLT